jgi:hypothetical protein
VEQSGSIVEQSGSIVNRVAKRRNSLAPHVSAGSTKEATESPSGDGTQLPSRPTPRYINHALEVRQLRVRRRLRPDGYRPRLYQIEPGEL